MSKLSDRLVRGHGHGWALLGLSYCRPCMAGCASVSQDVMRITARWLTTTKRPRKRRRWTPSARERDQGTGRDGRIRQARRAERELDRVKAWEASARRRRTDSRKPPNGRKHTSTSKSRRFLTPVPPRTRLQASGQDPDDVDWMPCSRQSGNPDKGSPFRIRSEIEPETSHPCPAPSL